ncbi:MAG: M20/M25/M40 family metallo-hydrolase [Muribaculaceae bacterium]|nr:M20/M25/M40 family metallo-hydrolase [Muribaculaceae bacterium]
MKCFILTALALLLSISAGAGGTVRDEMLDTFVKYAGIDSQSSYTETTTAGQRAMALAIKADADAAIAESGVRGAECSVSDDNYVYVRVPANTKKACPSLGISCHIDVTPEAPGGNINPIIDTRNGRTIVRTDGTTLLGADDKCGCTIAMQLLRTLLRDRKLRHGEVVFAFCPNEDVGRAADGIDTDVFAPDILFDLDGEEGSEITNSNFTARGFNVRFIGRDAHAGKAKEQGFGDAVAAAATYIAAVPLQHRPENTDKLQGYIHPWSFEQKPGEMDVTVQTRVRYFDKAEGELFDGILQEALANVRHSFPNVAAEVIYDGVQYENVAATLYPGVQRLVEEAAARSGKSVEFRSSRGGTTASMLAARGMNGGMCVFTGQHDIHSTREYADLQEMEEAYTLMLEIIRTIPTL